MLSFFTNILEPISYSIYFLAFLYRLWHNRQSQLWVPVIFYLFATLIMSYASYLVKSNTENVYLYNFMLLPASILFFSWYFMRILRRNLHKVVWIILALNGVLFVVRHTLMPYRHLFASIGFATLSISILVYCFVYFRQLLSEVSEMPIYGNFNFWVVCSFFISYSGSFLVFLTYYYLTEKISTDYVHKNRILLTLLWGIPNVLLFIGGLFTLTGSIWTNYHRKS